MNRTTTARQRRNQVEAGKALAAQEKAENEKRLKRLYGDLQPDVELLRRRGFVVDAQARGVYTVGNKTLDGDGLKAMADRERRLQGVALNGHGHRPATTATGLKIGDKVAIAPKAPPAGSTPLSTEKTGLGARRLSGAAATAAAKAMEHSASLGAVPLMEWIEIDKLTVDRSYQRQVTTDHGRKHINRILRAFSWAFYEPIKVTPLKGTGPGELYAVIDGQHRLEAAKKHPLIDKLPCYVVDAAAIADQAAIFISANSARIAVLRIHKFWAAHAAGEKTARTIARLCVAAGVTIARGQMPRPVPPLTTISTWTLEKLLPLGQPPIAQALRILATAHPTTADAFRSANIAALTRIMAGDKAPAEKTAIALLKRLDLAAELGRAQVQRATDGGNIEQAMEKILRRRFAGGG